MSHEWSKKCLQDSVTTLSRIPREIWSGFSRKSLLDSMGNHLRIAWEIPPEFHEKLCMIPQRNFPRYRRKYLQDCVDPRFRVKFLLNWMEKDFIDNLCRIPYGISPEVRKKCPIHSVRNLFKLPWEIFLRFRRGEGFQWGSGGNSTENA